MLSHLSELYWDRLRLLLAAQLPTSSKHRFWWWTSAGLNLATRCFGFTLSFFIYFFFCGFSKTRNKVSCCSPPSSTIWHKNQHDDDLRKKKSVLTEPAGSSTRCSYWQWGLLEPGGGANQEASLHPQGRRGVEERNVHWEKRPGLQAI